jgi:hypothetical protein
MLDHQLEVAATWWQVSSGEVSPLVAAEQRLRAGQKFFTNLSTFFEPVKLQLQELAEIEKFFANETTPLYFAQTVAHR